MDGCWFRFSIMDVAAIWAQDSSSCGSNIWWISEVSDRISKVGDGRIWMCRFGCSTGVGSSLSTLVITSCIWCMVMHNEIFVVLGSVVLIASIVCVSAVPIVVPSLLAQ